MRTHIAEFCQICKSTMWFIGPDAKHYQIVWGYHSNFLRIPAEGSHSSQTTLKVHQNSFLERHPSVEQVSRKLSNMAAVSEDNIGVFWGYHEKKGYWVSRIPSQLLWYHQKSLRIFIFWGSHHDSLSIAAKGPRILSEFLKDTIRHFWGPSIFLRISSEF